MRILGIESASLVASVAIVTDDVITAEYTVNLKKTHSQTLLPMIDEIVKMLEVPLESIDAIAVSGGPGSFTGLRIGSATAKGLGLALKKPLIHVPTMDAMGYCLYGASALICPMLDARRQQVYTGLYRYEEKFEIVKEQYITDIHALIAELNERGERVIFLGDGVPVNRVCTGTGEPSASFGGGSAWRSVSGRGKDRDGSRAQAGLSAEIAGGARARGRRAPGRDG